MRGAERQSRHADYRHVWREPFELNPPVDSKYDQAYTLALPAEPTLRKKKEVYLK